MSFKYKAKDDQGHIIEGKLESDSITDASREIMGRGLELLSLEKSEKPIEEMRSFLFKALHDGEPVEGRITGTDEESVREKLQKQFGYRITSIRSIDIPTVSPEKIVAESVTEKARKIRNTDDTDYTDDTDSKITDSTDAKEGIIFSSSPRIVQKTSVVPDAELDNERQTIQFFLQQHGSLISPHSRAKLGHLDGMIELVRENQDKKRWKNLKREIYKAIKAAERELKWHQDKKWAEYEQQQTQPVQEQSATTTVQPTPQFVRTPSAFSKFMDRIKIFDQPSEENKKEVLLKHQYEAVWTELQRFSGALLVFYLAVLFVSYYLKRSGVSDTFLVRIYDTTLFKQLVLGLFTLYGIFSIRRFYLPKRVKMDGLLIGLILVSSWWIFWY